MRNLRDTCHRDCYIRGEKREPEGHGCCRVMKMEKGMYRQRIQKAWGHTAHRGWARLLNRARDLIIYDPAHHGANGAAMPTDEDDQDGHFLFNHPEGGGLLRCLDARSHCYCSLDPIPPT